MPGWVAQLFLEIPKTKHHRSQQRSKSAPEKPKMDVPGGPSDPKIDENSTKCCSGALQAALGRSGFRRERAGTRSERPLDAKLGRLGHHIGRLGRYVGRVGRQVDGPGRSQDAPKRTRSTTLSPQRVRNAFAANSHASGAAKTTVFACLPPVWAILQRAAVMREKLRKSRRFGFENRVRGPFERASRAQKRPVRAKKFARSACGASENLKVSANESTSSEQERLQAAKTRAPPEASEGILSNFEMDFQPPPT